MKNDTTTPKQSNATQEKTGGGWMGRLVRGWRARKKARTIARIRAHFAFFGYDITGLSDDEIEERSRIIAQAAATCGISAKDAAMRIQTISRAMNRPKFPENRMIEEGSIRDAFSSANSQART